MYKRTFKISKGVSSGRSPVEDTLLALLPPSFGLAPSFESDRAEFFALPLPIDDRRVQTAQSANQPSIERELDLSRGIA